MRHRNLRGGMVVTEIGFGAAQLGNLYRETSDADSSDAIEAAWDGGIRYFDTAPHYGLGLSEHRLGTGLARFPREEYRVSTKVGRLLVASPDTADQLDSDFIVSASTRRQWDFSRDGILRSLEESLGRLGLDRVDIVYLHDPDDHWEQASTTGIDALVELREQGVVGAIGAGMNQTAMLTEFIRRCDIDVVMLANRFTLLEQSPLDELLPLAMERHVGIVAAAVYNSGLLSNDRASVTAHYDYSAAPAELVRRANAIAEVCERYGVTLPQAAVAYPLRHPAVISVVLGTRTRSHVVSNLERYSTPIPEGLWAELEEFGLLRRW